MSEHTEGPWAQHEDEPDAIVAADKPHESLLTVDKNGMAKLWNEADARRIVACVNACDGIPTGHLELCGDDFLGHYTEMKDHERIVRQRDKLLKVVKVAEEQLRHVGNGSEDECIFLAADKCRAIIAEVEASK